MNRAAGETQQKLYRSLKSTIPGTRLRQACALAQPSLLPDRTNSEARGGPGLRPPANSCFATSPIRLCAALQSNFCPTLRRGTRSDERRVVDSLDISAAASAP